jgi:hypothetical protein
MFHIASKPNITSDDFLPFGYNLIPRGGYVPPMFPQGGIMPILPAFGFKPNTQVSSSELEKKILAAVDTKLASNPQSQNITKEQIQEMINNTMTQMKDQQTGIINDKSKSKAEIIKQIDLRIEQKLSNVTENGFKQLKQQLIDQLNQININLSSEYTEKIDNIKQELESNSNTSINKLQDEITRLTSRIGLFEGSQKTLTKSNKTLNKEIQEQKTNILVLTEQMEHQKNFSTNFINKLELIRTDITRLDNKTVDQYNNLLERINILVFTGDDVVDQINRIVSVLTHEQKELKQNYSQLDSKVQQNTNLIDNKIEQLKNNLDNKITRIKTEVEQQINKALVEQNKKFQHFTSQFTQQLNEFKNFKQKTISDQILKMDESIKNLNKNLDDFITQNNEQHQKIQTELGGKLNETNQTVLQIQNEHNNELKQMKDALLKYVTESIVEIKKDIENNTATNQKTTYELQKLDNFINNTVITQILNNEAMNKSLIQLISHNKEFLFQKLSKLSKNQEKIQTIINNIIPENEITKLSQGDVSLFERIITFEQKMEKWSNNNQILLRKSLMKALGEKSQKIHLALDQLQKQISQNDKQNKIALEGDKKILQQHEEKLRIHTRTLKKHGFALEHEKQQRQQDTQKQTNRIALQDAQNQQDKKQQGEIISALQANISKQKNKIKNHGIILTQNQEAIKNNKKKLSLYKKECDKSLGHIQSELEQYLEAQYNYIMNEINSINEKVLLNYRNQTDIDNDLHSRILQNNSNITVLKSMADNIENQLTADDVTLNNIISLIKKITSATKIKIPLFGRNIRKDGKDLTRFQFSKNINNWEGDGDGNDGLNWDHFNDLNEKNDGDWDDGDWDDGDGDGDGW